MSLWTNAAVTVDIAVATVADGELRLLLHRRAGAPFAGEWALPGVFAQPEETLEAAAARALIDKARLDRVFVEQLYTFGEPDRDPRGRVITVAYYALVPADRLQTALVDARDDSLRLLPAAALPRLAFDHARIAGSVVERLRGKLGYSAVGYELLPEAFTLRALRAIHEAILGRPLNKDSFRRRMLESGELEATGQRELGAAYRPAAYYRRRS